MQRQKQQSDLGISLRDMATILETGKKLTRGAKNQLKVNTIERQQGQKQSEVSFDSKKSIDTRKENKKNDKQVKKKEPVKVSIPQQLPHYLGVPNLQKYLASDTLQVQTSYEISKYNIVELGKNYFPSLIRVLLKTNLTKELYQVKRGELKRQKTTKDQFLIEFQHLTANRNEVRSITRQNGIVLIGQNVGMLKLNFQQWKQIFAQQIQEIRRQFQSKNEKLQSSEPKQDQTQKKQDSNQHEIEKKQCLEQNYPQKIEQQKSLQFVQILPNPERQFTLDNQVYQSIENVEDEKSRKESNKIDQQKYQDSKMVPQGQQWRQIGLTQQEIFKRFCLPACEFMLWPVIIYDTGLGDQEQLRRVIDGKKYCFSEKDRSRLFEKISKSKNGLLEEKTGCQGIKKSIKQREIMMGYFQRVIRPKIEKKQVDLDKDILGSQLNLMIYPLGLNRLIRVSESMRLQLLGMDMFPQQQFMAPLILSTLLRQCSQQWCLSIMKLNEFTNLQVTQTRSQDIRSSIDRLVKCEIQKKIYKGIVLRYSNLQKKMLVMLFNKGDGVGNEVKWVGVQQVYCNYTLPQITVKSKFLLYDTNQHNCKHQTLYKLFTQIYRHYLNKQLPNNNNNVNGISNNNNNCTNNLQINQPTLSINCPQDQQLPLITQPSIPNRCTTCYYPIHRLPHYKCIFCDNYSHQQCSAKTINKSIQLNANNIPNLWTCDHCQPCVVCLQPLKYQTISCSKCHTNLHQLCAKLKPQENLIRDKYSCQNCIQCKICQKKLKNLDYVLIKNGYQCINCYKAQQANQICHICKKQSDGRWAQCSRQFCGKWIHKNCDKYIQTRNNFFSTNNQQVYYCPFCRCIEKRRLVLKFIEIISIFDQYQYFISSDYEDILDYKYVVGTPMCFRKMYERCYEGCYDRNTMNEIKTDFQLIVSNALKYNMPKDQPHYQGRILNVLGQFAFQKFREQLECTQQQIIRGGLMQRMIQKKKQLYKQVYERYLQIILNFGAKWSSVQVKRPKQNIKAIEKMLPNQLTELQISGFNSRLLLKEVFRSAMIKFKLKKKPATIQNLFQTQKVTQAYKSTINSNFCYYHYWNSNTEFYCQQCMQYYCCVQKCYRHEICRYCGVKGCACDVYTCGCGVMKQKDRKYYQKLLTEKFYDRREITENYKLCLKCAFDKLNNKQCTYCEKSYEFYYDFQTCKQCKKIYHKQCADQHASESLAKFFFKHPQKTNQSQLFSTFLRLNDHCYECSISKGNKLQMFQKLKTESLQKLAKIQKLSKYQLLIVSILFENGIKLSLCDVLGLIMDNYKQFQAYEVIFQQYRVNYASVKLNQKLKIKVDDRLQNVVKSKIISQSKRQKQVQQYKQKLIQDLQKRNRLLLRNMRYLTQQIVDSIVINIQSLWGVKVHNRMLQSYYRQEMMNDNGNALQSQLIINDKELLRQYHQHVYQGYYGKLSSSHYRLQLVLQKYQQIKNRLKSNKILSQRVQFNNISVSNNQQLTNKKMNNNNIQSINSDKTILGNNNNNNNNNNINNKNNINKAQSKNNNNDIVISKQVSNKLLFDIINGVDLFSSFQQIRITKINQINQKNNKKSSYLCINNNNTTRIGILVSSIGILVSNTIDHTIGVNFSHINNLVYDLQHYGQRYQYIGRDIISYQYIGRDIISKQHKKQQQKYKQNHSNTNNNQHQYQQRATQQIDIQSTLQQMIHQQQQQSLPTTTHYNNHNKINITQQQQLSNIHSNHTNISKLSKYQHLSKIHQIITKFILKCFQYSKSVYRRGNTCLLKTEKHHWRVLKKYTNHQIHYNNTHQNIINYNKQSVYQITLKKQHNKWFFSINQNTWWVETIEQILQKLKPIIKLNNFRQLADFLGFTFKLIPLEKAHHFSHFLRSHPLDQLSAKDKKKLVVNLYDKFQWGKNGLCKNKITNVVNNTQQISRQQMIKQQGQKQQVIPRQQTQRQQVKQFVSVKKSLFYLGRRRKQPKQQNNSIVQIKQQSLQRQQPYITYQDMKRDLQEISGQAAQKRKQLQPKQYVINQSRVFIGPSPIHKLGLFAKQNYPKFTTMIQYIGQIVSESTADVREAIFHFGCYMFGLNRRNVDRRQIIDATFRGNMARYLNHSCDPNCKAKIQLINNQPKIFIYSIREVKQFQELTYDYQFSVDANQKLTCTCGAKNCQGRLN